MILTNIVSMDEGRMARVADISPITDNVYISAWPRGRHALEIRGLGVRLILSMHWVHPSKTLGHAPVRLLWLPTFDSPLFPMPMSALERGVQAALPVIEAGGKVLVHCRAGIHRSVAMACCILIAQGMSAEAAMALCKQRRPVADPDAPHIRERIVKFEAVWQTRTDWR
jgi:hypothetical protein